MRRKDKEIKDRAEIENILKMAMVCRLGLCSGDMPYVVPMCFGYDGKALYFHAAGEGMKLDILRKNPNVCFEAELENEVMVGGKACSFSMRYKTVVGFGTAEFVLDAETKIKALDIIVSKYSDGSFDYPPKMVDGMTILKVEIDSMTGKQSGF